MATTYRPTKAISEPKMSEAVKESLVRTVFGPQKQQKRVYERKTYITLGSQGPPCRSRHVAVKHQQRARRVAKPIRAYASAHEEVAYKRYAERRAAFYRRTLARQHLLGCKELSLSQLQPENLIRLFGYGPYTGQLHRLVWSERAQWKLKKAAWARLDKHQQKQSKQDVYALRKAFWHGSDMRDAKHQQQVWPSYKTKRTHVAKVPRIDNSARARVIWETQEPAKRSVYYLAKLHLALDKLRAKRVRGSPFTKYLRQVNAYRWMDLFARQQPQAKVGQHEMDIQDSPIGEVGQEHEKLGNVTLEQQSVEKVEATIGSSIADVACAPEVVDACPEIISRGLYLDTLVWKSTDNTDAGVVKYDLISDIFSKLKEKNTPNLLLFDVYRYCKLDVELIFTANTTMFHSGMLQISVTYLKDSTKNTSYYNSIYTLSQRHHVILNAGAGNEVSIIVPWDYYKSYLYFDKDDTQGGRDFASVMVKVLSPLRTSSTSPTEVDIMVYAKLHKVNFTGMIPKNFKAFSHEMDIIGTATRVVSSFLADPNRDLPSIPGSKVVMQPQSSQSLCYGANADVPINSLRMDPSVQTPHPQKMVDFNLNTVKRIWGLIKCIPGGMSVNSNVGAMIWSTEVSPILPKESLYKCERQLDFDPGSGAMSLATYAYPPVSVLGSMYGYWSGSLEFKVQIVQTKFHSGRIIIGFLPGIIPEKYKVTIDDLRNSLHTVYNLQDANEIVYRVPYLSHTPVQPRLYVNGTFGSNFPSIGSLFIMVANRLAISDNVVGSISFNIYFRGGADLEFFHPVAPSLIPGTSRQVKVRGIHGQWVAGYVPIGVGIWRDWTFEGKYLPIFRYGDISDHISQFTCNVFGVYDLGASRAFLMWDMKSNKEYYQRSTQWAVPMRIGTYTYMIPFLSESTAIKYCNSVHLEDFVKGNKQPQMEAYARIIVPAKDTATIPCDTLKASDQYPLTYAIFEHESMRDATEAVEVVNVTPAGPLGRTLFGEKLCGLKDLTRRYQFVGSYRKNDTDIHDNPLYTDVIIPVCPTYQTNQAPPYDRLGVHPTALLASGYRGFRGSLRYKFIFRSDVSATIYVQHRFDSRSKSVEEKQFVHGIDDLIGTGYATFVQHTGVNCVFDIEIPYYSIYNYLIVGPQKDSPNSHEKTIMCNGTLLISVDTNKPWTLDVWSSFGDDASLHMFQGFPPMALTSGLPLDLIPEQLAPKVSLESEFEKVGMHEGLVDYIPGVNLYRKATTAIDTVNSCAEKVDNVATVLTETGAAIKSKFKSATDIILGIPSVAASLGTEAWNSLLQLLQVYLNPTGKAIAVCVVGILLNICSQFKDYTDGLYNALVTLFKGQGLFEVAEALFEDDASPDMTDESKINDLYNQPGSSISPEPNEEMFRIPKFGKHEMEIQNQESWLPITSLLVTAVSGICGKRAPTYSPGKLLTSAVASIPDQAKSTMFVIKYLAILISLVKAIADHVKRTFWPEVAELDVADKSINAWYKLSCELTDPTQYDAIRIDQPRVDQVYNEVRRGESIVIVAAVSDDKQIRAIVPTLRTKLGELRKVKQRLFEERITTSSYTTPFCLWMYGRPGIGKSVGGAKVRADLMRSAGIQAPAEVSYTISPGKKHLDGLTNQPCVIFDDFGAIDDSTKTPDLVQMFMEMISSEPYRPPMAALEDKKIVHNAEIVYINSNLAYPRYSCVADMDAFNRRRHALIYVKAVGDPLIIDDTADLPPPEMVPNSLDHLEFAFLDPRDQTSEYRIEQENFMCYDEMIELLKEQFNDHREKAIELAACRMAEERDLRVEQQGIRTTFDTISNQIQHALAQDHHGKIGAHQIKISEDDQPSCSSSIAPILEDYEDEPFTWELAQDNPMPATATSDVLVSREVAASTLGNHVDRMVGDSRLRARARVNHLDDGTNTPEQLTALVNRRTEIDELDFDLMRAEAILAGKRLDTSICTHAHFSTSMYYEEGVFVGNCQVLGNVPCDPINFRNCRWLDNAQYETDMMEWWRAHSREMLKRIEIIRINRDITENDIPPYFVKMFQRVNKQQKMIAEAEQSWLKWLQYYICYTLPSALIRLLEFVRKHLVAICVIIYVVFLVTMMGLGTYMTIQDAKAGIPSNVRGPQVYRPPYVHQVVASGDNHTQRAGNVRKIAKQLIKDGNHELEFDQQTKDVMRIVGRNTWFMCCVNSKDEIICECRVIALKAQKLLVLKHYCEYLEGLLKKHEGSRIVLVRPSCVLPWNFVDFGSVEYNSEDGTGTFGILQGPSTMPLAHDLTRQLAPAKYHDACDLSKVVLCIFNMCNHPTELVPGYVPTSAWIDTITAQAAAGMSAIEYKDAYSYAFSGPGTCGSVLISGGFIIGIHVAGWNGYGVAQPICKEWYRDRVVKEITPLFPANFLPIEQAKLILSTSNLPLGVCPPDVAHHESGKSKIVPSKLFGVFPVTTEPAPLHSKDERLKGEHAGQSPMLKGCEKHGELVSDFPRKLLDEATEDLAQHLISVVKPVRGKPGVLTVEQAIMGFPGRDEYTKLEMNTSEGYPWVSRRPPGAHNKRWMFDIQQRSDGTEQLVGVNETLMAALSVNDSLRRKGVKPFTVYTDCLKDARIAKEKCARADKTRIFSISPVDHTIACRQYFADFAAAYQNSRFENECGIGVVVQGPEWTKLYTYLTTLSPHIVCGDYSNFGPGLQSAVVRSAFDIIIRWYQSHGATMEDTLSRRVLAEENVNSIHQMFNLLYHTCGGAPSGNPLTAIINSLVNCLYIRMAWREITGMAFTEYYRYVRLVVYGDDLIMSVHPLLIGKFNNRSIQAFFSKYQIKYTDIDKGDGQIRLYCTIEEASFLKRTFLPHPTRAGQFLACAEVQSVEDCANWVRQSPDLNLASLVNATTSCDLAYSRGIAYHTKAVKTIRSAWNRLMRLDKSVPILKIRTWEELDALFYSDEWKGQPWTEQHLIGLGQE
uniref:Genome polyprotein n=1 Tax=Soybean thrips iflavirus 2 TaxID=2797873 RepID=A0A7T7WLU0_9VIRU|nr:polyprotein [Soybean thrips iflavirus 2]